MTKLKIAAIAAALTIITAGVSGCGQPASAANIPDDKLRIVCTVFPEYDWVKQIMGDKASNAEITYLLGNGIDLHNFQPTADDMITISACDLFLYVGGESDKWAEDALTNTRNKDMKVINLLEAVGDNVKEEELKEGMQGEDEDEHHHHDHDEDEDHDDDEEHDHHHDDEPEYDEHVWLSVKNAKLICSDIADKLCAIDPDNAEAYKANLASYTGQLDELDRDFASLGASSKTLVFADRFPFRYFTDDYGFDYYAAFVGCSAETEASFETIAFLAQKVDELGCKTIYTIENSDKKIAETVIASTKSRDQSIAELNSLQSVSLSDADSGVGYISLMRKNYEVLRSTL